MKRRKAKHRKSRKSSKFTWLNKTMLIGVAVGAAATYFAFKSGKIKA